MEQDWKAVKGQLQQPGPNKGSESSRMKVWVTFPSKEPTRWNAGRGCEKSKVSGR